MMKAGQTDLEVGQKIIIQGITGEDSDLNGLTGTVTHPFAFGATNKGWIGIYLDQKGIRSGDKVNVKTSEIVMIEESPFEVGQMTNLGCIEDKTNTQVCINNKWYANSLVSLKEDWAITEIEPIELEMDIIEGEVLKNYLPEGSFGVLVNQDCFDEDMFEYHIGQEGFDKDKMKQEDWIEVLLVDDSPAEAYAVQGQAIFINKITQYVLVTQDTSVKCSEDVTLIKDNTKIDYAKKIAQLNAPLGTSKDLNNG